MVISDNAKSDVLADTAIKLDTIDRQIVENDVCSEEYDVATLKFANIMTLIVGVVAMSVIVILGLVIP